MLEIGISRWASGTGRRRSAGHWVIAVLLASISPLIPAGPLGPRPVSAETAPAGPSAALPAAGGEGRRIHLMPPPGSRPPGAPASRSRAASQPPRLQPLYYQGGHVLTTPRLYLDFWGPEWNDATTVVATMPGPGRNGEPAQVTQAGLAGVLKDFAGSLGGSEWFRIATQHCQSSARAQTLWPGTLYTTNTLPGDQVCPSSGPQQAIQNSSLQYDSTQSMVDPTPVPQVPTQADIDAAAIRAATYFRNARSSADPNAVYVVVTPNGKYQVGYPTQFCAYHTDVIGGPVEAPDVRFAYIPMKAGDPGCAPTTGNGSLYDALTQIIAHEYVEAATDPGDGGVGAAWLTDPAYPGNNGVAYEDADVCNSGLSGPAPALTTNPNNTHTFAVPLNLSNVDGPGGPKCVASTGIPGPPEMVVATNTSVNWSVPANPSPSPGVDYYQVWCAPACSPELQKVPDPGSASTFSANFTLGGGGPAQVYVRAHNAIGYGPVAASKVVQGGGTAATIIDVPGEPTALSLRSPAAGAVSLSFSPPASDGGYPVTGYQCWAFNVGGSQNPGPVPAAGGTCTIRNLIAGARYVLAVTATNPLGRGWPAYTRPVVVDGGYYSPAPSPSRLLDTRYRIGSPNGPLGPGGSLDLQVAGSGPVPAGATAVVMNVTAVTPTAPGFLTVWPSGSPLPTVSNLNFPAGKTIANLVTVKLGAGGRVSIYNYSGLVDVAADVAGWYTEALSGPAADTFNPLPAPVRLLDTRAGVPVGPNASIDLQVVGVTGSGVPVTGVDAVVLNVTTAGSTAGGFLTVYPGGQPLPTASNLNFRAGEVIANLAIATVGGSGRVSIYNYAGATHVVVDIVGYYAAGGQGLVYVPVVPFRSLDTRQLGPGVQVSGNTAYVQGAPNFGATISRQALALNVTVTDTTASGYLTVWPCGSAQPLASNLNWTAGQTIPNQVMTGLGTCYPSAGGAFTGYQVYNFGGPDNLVIDVMGFFT